MTVRHFHIDDLMTHIPVPLSSPAKYQFSFNHHINVTHHVTNMPKENSTVYIYWIYRKSVAMLHHNGAIHIRGVGGVVDRSGLIS